MVGSRAPADLSRPVAAHAVSLEVVVICDGCGRVLDGARTGAEARRTSKEQMGAAVNLPGGRDLCGECR